MTAPMPARTTIAVLALIISVLPHGAAAQAPVVPPDLKVGPTMTKSAPDQKFGPGYLEELRRVRNQVGAEFGWSKIQSDGQ